MKTPFTTLLLVLTLGFAPANMAAQPPNDLIQDAIDLAYVPIPYTGTVVDFTTATATNDDTPASGCGLSQPGVWYKFTAVQNGIVAVDIIIPDNAAVIFFEGPATGVTSGMQLTYVNQATNPCGEANPITSIQAVAGTTYYIYMRNLVDSDILISAGNVFVVPPNDLIENALDINNMEDLNDPDIHFLMATETNDNSQVGCPTSGESGVWYKFTAPNTGQVVAGISSPPTSSAIIFYSAVDENATMGSDVTYVIQATNPCGLDNLTSISAVAGTTYYVYAISQDDAYATVSINLSGIMSSAENTLEGFEFYPNPVDNELNLNARSIIDEVSIYNIQGKKVYFKAIRTKKSQLNLGKLSSGLYLITVFSEGKMGSYKLVKQ